MQHLPVVVFVIDSAGFFRAVAGRPMRHFVHNSKAVIGQSLADITNNNLAILANVQRALQGDAFAAVVETRGHIFETRYEPIRDARGMIHGVLGMAVSITRRVHAEAALDQLCQQIAAQATGLLDAIQQPASTLDVIVAPPPEIASEAPINDLQTTLTNREQTVLRDVVAGKTNQQIAQELHISPKTVAKHLTSIYAKLGVASRPEAVALVVRTGMVELVLPHE